MKPTQIKNYTSKVISSAKQAAKPVIKLGAEMAEQAEIRRQVEQQVATEYVTKGRGK